MKHLRSPRGGLAVGDMRQTRAPPPTSLPDKHSETLPQTADLAFFRRSPTSSLPFTFSVVFSNCVVYLISPGPMHLFNTLSHFLFLSSSSENTITSPFLKPYIRKLADARGGAEGKPCYLFILRMS